MIEFTISAESLRLICQLILVCLLIAIIVLSSSLIYFIIRNSKLKMYKKIGATVAMILLCIFILILTLNQLGIISFAVV
jgi:hypothetical protein